MLRSIEASRPTRGRHVQYRPAIDGLRALAVLFVLMFHAKLPIFGGGYIGVDIFFVISGYLITKLIHNEFISDNFTLILFYERRARRILPALFLVAITTLAAGTLVLLPPDLAELGSSAVAATLFVSNIYFLKTQDYFLNESESMPLLHTWSLAIEEQFYILFPIFMILTLRHVKRSLSLAFIGVILCSFAISLYLTWTHPQAAFYLAPTRAWELLLGAWIAVTGVKSWVPPSLRPALQMTGLIMILWATFYFDSYTTFPGIAALVPCLGTTLIIAWCDEDSLITRAISHRSLVFFGLISYPLYLWHWPLLVMTKLVLLRHLHFYEVLVLYILAVGLAVATWHYIEKPIRARPGPFSGRQLLVTAVGVGCLTITMGAGIRATDGLWNRLPPNVAQILEASKDVDHNRFACHNWNRKTPEQFQKCTIGSASRTTFDFALWGDSIANSLASAVDSAANSMGKKGLQMTSAGCPPLLQTQVFLRHRKIDCDDRNDAAFALLRQYQIRQVILVGEWGWYAEGKGFRQEAWPVSLIPKNGPHNMAEDGAVALQRALKETADRLHAEGIHVTVVGPIPEIGWNVPAVLAALEWRARPLPEGPSQAEFMDRQRRVWPILSTLERDNVHIVYPHRQLCNATCIVESEGNILYRDGEHLTIHGAELLRPLFAAALSSAGMP